MKRKINSKKKRLQISVGITPEIAEKLRRVSTKSKRLPSEVIRIVLAHGLGQWLKFGSYEAWDAADQAPTDPGGAASTEQFPKRSEPEQ